jgi:phosphatidylglycerol---prolipoprotein diacylglyceryl transferase
LGIPADLAIKPAWIPTWLWAQTYDNNILGVTIRAPGVYPPPHLRDRHGARRLGDSLEREKPPFPSGRAVCALSLARRRRAASDRAHRANALFHVFGVSATQAQLVFVIFILMAE